MGRTLGQPKEMEAKKRQAQDRVLALLAQGHTIDAALKAVGRQRSTFYRWCDEEVWFKDRANAVRTPERGEKRGDFVEFRSAYLGFTTPWHQQQIIDAIESAPERSVTMILLPPGGGKTTVLEDYYNYLLGEDPNFRICVISEVQTLGRKILRRVSNRMTDRGIAGAYIDRYGPFRAPDRADNKPWGADRITLVQANSGERDYSLEVLGAGSTIYGASYDLIVLDDVQSLKKLSSTEKLVDYFRQDVYTRIIRANSKGKIIIVGTRVGPDDFYERLLKMEFPIQLVKIPALDEHGHSYFPKKTLPDGMSLGFSEEELEEIRQVVGEETWSRVYMQEPVSKRGQTFTNKMVTDAQNEDRKITDLDDATLPGMMRIAGLDPALSGHAVFRVASFDYQKLWLLDGRNEEGLARYEAIWDIVEELSAKWRPAAWVIEGNAIQGGLLRSDRIQDLSRQYGFSIVAHQTGRNKQDDIIGVASMAGSFLRHEIDIPWGDEEARRCFGPMCDELRAWRPDVPTKLLRQDEVMTLWFLHLHWYRKRSELASSVRRNVQARGLPYAPTPYPFFNRQPVGVT